MKHKQNMGAKQGYSQWFKEYLKMPNRSHELNDLKSKILTDFD